MDCVLSGPDLWGGGWGPWPSTEGRGVAWLVPRSLAPTFVGTCSPLIRPPRQRPERPLRSPSTSPGERVALSVTRGAGCGCPVVPGTEPLQEIHGVAGVQRGLGVSREGVDSFPSGPTSSCLRPSQTPMEVVPVFPNRAARVWGDRLEGAGQAASPWEPLAQLKGASGRRRCPSLGVGQHLFPGEPWGWPGAARPAARALCRLREPGCQLRGAN